MSHPADVARLINLTGLPNKALRLAAINDTLKEILDTETFDLVAEAIELTTDMVVEFMSNRV